MTRTAFSVDVCTALGAHECATVVYVETGEVFRRLRLQSPQFRLHQATARRECRVIGQMIHYWRQLAPSTSEPLEEGEGLEYESD